MSLDSNFHELQLSDCRKTLGVDDFSVVGSEENSEETNDSMKQVRMSLAWDSAFLASPGILEPEELFRSANSDMFSCEDEILLSSGSREPNVNGISNRCDLRKSLAWDKAFFANAGFLDAEELAKVNRGFKKSEAHLPEIAEDVLKSTESSRSINTGYSSLTSLEIDLFEDIRESRHKSTNASSHSDSSFKLHRIKALNKLDACCKTRMSGSTPRGYYINPSVEKRCTTRTSSSAPAKKRLAAAGNLLPSLRPLKSAVQHRNMSAVSTKVASYIAKADSGEIHSVGPKRVKLKKINSLPRYPTPTPTSSAKQKLYLGSLCNRDSVLKTPRRDSSGELSTKKLSYCSSPESYTDGWSMASTSTSMTQRSETPKASTGTTRTRTHVSGPDRGNTTPLRTVSLPSRTSKKTKPFDQRPPSPSLNAEISSAAKRDGSANPRKPKSGGQSPVQVKVNESTIIRIRLPAAYNVEKVKNEDSSEERKEIVLVPRGVDDNKENVCGFGKVGGDIVIEIYSDARSSILTLIV